LAVAAASLATAAAAQDAQKPQPRDSLGAGADRQLSRRKTWEPTPPPSDPRDFTGIWEVPNPKIDLKQDDGKDPPFTPEEAKSTQRMIDAEKAGAVITDASTQCFPHGVPRLTFAPYPIRFVHAPGKILMLHEGRPQRAHHLHGQEGAAEGHANELPRLFGGPLGGKHPGGRDHPPEQPDAA
jgi:hypothetical protein